MPTNIRAICVLLFLITLAVSCGTQDTVTIPPSDTTQPTVVMDIHFPEGRIYTVTSTGFNPTMPTHLGANDEISLVAKGEDTDGGIQDIQLWIGIGVMICDPNTGDCVLTGPGLASAPAASNPDTAKQPGETALKTRLVSHKLDIRQIRGGANGVTIEISARAINFQGVIVKTTLVTLTWP
ncbi:MAG: hypothetical protein L0287_11020 [Anaerolineae bacterium]|nr:hypothetical protein [Anaerolineae bacterium]MCI0609256.1 hypothetical protein [Anaerolineae bacterium]